MLITCRPCNHCSKAKKQCLKSRNARRTACRTCNAQKKQCIWRGTPPVKGKRLATRSPKPIEDSEQVPEYSVANSIQDLRKDVVEMRRDMVDLRVELVALNSGQTKILAQHAEAKKQMDRLEELLRSLQGKGDDKMDTGN